MTQGKVICKECVFFNRFDYTCRRFPPTPVTHTVPEAVQLDSEYRFPSVSADWWCGEAKSNELNNPPIFDDDHGPQ